MITKTQDALVNFVVEPTQALVCVSVKAVFCG